MRKIEDLFKDNSSSTLQQSSSVQDNTVTFKGTGDVFSLGFFFIHNGTLNTQV